MQVRLYDLLLCVGVVLLVVLAGCGGQLADPGTEGSLESTETTTITSTTTTTTTPTDSDNDNLSDSREQELGTDPGQNDTDDDGLSDWEEVENYSTDPTLNDTDGDGLTDGEEIHQYGTNPTKADSDNDSVLDGEEITAGADPLDTDTDNDTLTDAEELNEYSTSPTKVDTDGDGLNDSAELNQFGTDPTRYDTDGDGLHDREEINEYPTDPVKADTDGDRIPDGAEVQQTGVLSEADPLRKDVFVEVDYMEGTNPNRVDFETIKSDFANAPISNEHGEDGISLHIKIDDEVPSKPVLNMSEGDFAHYYENHSDHYHEAYYYAMMTEDIVDLRGPGGPVEFGGMAKPDGRFVFSEDRFPTNHFAHELGHVLGLDEFEGIDSHKYSRSEYPSVMNYNVDNYIGYSTGNSSSNDHNDWRKVSSKVNRDVSTATIYPGCADISFEGGDGTPTNPYKISTAAQLQCMGTEPTGHFVLVNDIDASQRIFEPIGKDRNPSGNFGSPYPFTGSLDGQGYTIYNLTIKKPNKYSHSDTGFIRRLEGQVKNVHFQNADVQGGRGVGIVAGTAIHAEIHRVTVNGTVDGTNSVGGIVGSNSYYSNISCAGAWVSVDGRSGLGGIAGGARGSVNNVYAKGSITAHAPGKDGPTGGLVGGLVGNLTNGYSTVKISAEDEQGPIVGEIHEANLSNVYWNRTLTGLDASKGNQKGTELPVANMTGDEAKTHFTGLDFGQTWETTEGYPVLSCEPE